MTSDKGTNKGLMALTLMFAEIIEMPDLIERLKESIKEYDDAQLVNASTKEAENHIGLYAMLFLQKTSKRSAVDTINDIEKIEKAIDVITPKEG